MVTRKIAAKSAAGTVTSKAVSSRSGASVKTGARASSKAADKSAPVKAPGKSVAKIDGKLDGKLPARSAKTADIAPIKVPTKVSAKVSAKVATKSAGKVAAKTPAKKASSSVTKAGGVKPSAKAAAAPDAKRAPTKAPARVQAKVPAKPAGGTAASVATVSTTRRVVAKRDDETRIVTPEIAAIETDVVDVAVTGVVPVPSAPGAGRPSYWDQACSDLMKRDRILKKLIPQFGPAHLAGRGDPFVTLARSIVGQQISVKAAQSVWDRVLATCPKLTPAQFIKAGHDALAGCGLSRRKAEYILDLATHFKSGVLHVDAWATMDDEAVIAELTGIRGIGRWTAEMFLMFNLLRPDVLPLDDVGLINAISVNYFSGEPVTRSEAREVAANWEPWRSVATWYMWRSLEPVPVQY